MTLIELAVKKILELFPDVQGIYLFGSFAAGAQTPASDLDLAVLTKTKLERIKLWEVSQLIAQEINRDVDLIDLADLAQVSTVFAFEIINHGKRIFTGDEIACARFENTAISMYLRFQEERKPILDEIKARKGNIL